MAKKYHSLSSRKEKKLKYDYKKIEKTIQEIIEKYKINEVAETKLNEIFSKLDKNQIYTNLQVLLNNQPKKNYKIVLNYQDFNNFIQFLKNYLLEKLEQEKNSDNEYLNEVINNLFEEIKLTMFEQGISRITLTAFHYYLKVLERYAKMYLSEFEVTNINRVKNPLELFIKDLTYIISKNEELVRFTITLKSLIEQWINKYNKKTKIGDFYYNLLLITPEIIAEKILKYLLFTAIKNKNPLELRAIFSSYLTLIHQNLFSFYATNLSKVKIGYFKQLENLFTENFDLILDQKNNKTELILNILMFSYLNEHKKLFNDYYYVFFTDDYLSQNMEINYFHFFDVYSKFKDKIELLDFTILYSTTFKYINFDKLENFKTNYQFSQFYRLNTKFFKNNLKKNLIKYIENVAQEHLLPLLNKKLDKEDSEQIINFLAKELVLKITPNYFLDKNFKMINNDKKTKLIIKEIDLLIKDLKSIFF